MACICTHNACIILSYSTQTIPAATKVCVHISRAIDEISKAQEPSPAHTQGLFMDSVSQIKVQHVPRVMGQAMAWGWQMPVRVPGTGHVGQGWIHLPDQRVPPQAEGERSCPQELPALTQQNQFII